MILLCLLWYWRQVYELIQDDTYCKKLKVSKKHSSTFPLLFMPNYAVFFLCVSFLSFSLSRPLHTLSLQEDVEFEREINKMRQ